MKNLVLLIFCLCCLSCATLQISEDRNSKNVKAVGIEWSYSEKVDERYQPMVDSAINQLIREFNSEKHLFTVHKKLPKDKDYITIDFNKGKIASKGQQIAGYVVSAVGLIGAPVALIAAESPIIVAFYYFPENRLDSKISVSSFLAADKSRDKRLSIGTGALFANRTKQVNKLTTKFEGGLKDVLLKIEQQVSAR